MPLSIVADRRSRQTPVHGLFEAHLTVSDLTRAIEFYRDAVGLELAHIARGREAAFFWVGSGGNSMLGVWAAGPGPLRVKLRVAFRTTVADVIAAPSRLRAAGIEALDFVGKPIERPIVLAWIPAASVSFRDPDGHHLQYVATLDEPARPELGIIPWRMWELARGSASHSGSSQMPR